MPGRNRKLEWDLVVRLREGRTNGTMLCWTVGHIHLEAADEIERLRKKVQLLESEKTS